MPRFTHPLRFIRREPHEELLRALAARVVGGLLFARLRRHVYWAVAGSRGGFVIAGLSQRGELRASDTIAAVARQGGSHRRWLSTL